MAHTCKTCGAVAAGARPFVRSLDGNHHLCSYCGRNRPTSNITARARWKTCSMSVRVRAAGDFGGVAL